MLRDIKKNEEGASETLIQNLRKQIDFDLPEEYIAIMKKFNGGEGEIGENSWLCLFCLEELPKTNHNYKYLMSEIPAYYLFGKDAADTGYAFHKRNQTFHSFGLMSNFKTDPIEFCGNNFSEFIECLFNT